MIVDLLAVVLEAALQVPALLRELVGDAGDDRVDEGVLLVGGKAVASVPVRGRVELAGLHLVAIGQHVNGRLRRGFRLLALEAALADSGDPGPELRSHACHPT